MAEDIGNLITLIVDDLKLALDTLFDIIEEEENSRPTGYPRYTNIEKTKRIQKARDLYHKHFV